MTQRPSKSRACRCKKETQGSTSIQKGTSGNRISDAMEYITFTHYDAGPSKKGSLTHPTSSSKARLGEDSDAAPLRYQFSSAGQAGDKHSPPPDYGTIIHYPVISADEEEPEAVTEATSTGPCCYHHCARCHDPERQEECHEPCNTMFITFFIVFAMLLLLYFVMGALRGPKVWTG